VEKCTQRELAGDRPKKLNPTRIFEFAKWKKESPIHGPKAGTLRSGPVEGPAEETIFIGEKNFGRAEQGSFRMSTSNWRDNSGNLASGGITRQFPA